MCNLLEVKSVEKTLHRFINFKWETNKPAKNISMHIKQGEILGILGPNGAGKSTTLRMITGELTPDAGCVIFDGKDITSLPIYKRCAAGLGYMPQEHSLFNQMTVENNLIGIMQMQGFSKQECRSRCEELMEIFNLNHIRHNLAATISGGEKRRLEIARALTRRPKMLVLDEPFAGVDPIVTKMIIELVFDLCENWGIAILITDHDFRCIAQMVERCYVIFGGEVVFEGTPEEMVNNDFVQQIYLGKEEEEIITIDESGYRRVKSLHDSYHKKRMANFKTQPSNVEQNDASFLTFPQNNPINQEQQIALQPENSATEQFVSGNGAQSTPKKDESTDSELSELFQSVQTSEFQTNELDNAPSATLADFIQNNNSLDEEFQPMDQITGMPSEEAEGQENNQQRQRKIPPSGPTIKPFRRKKQGF